MSRYKSKGDVVYILPGKKRPIAYSTIAASNLISALAQDMPNATIQEVHDAINYDIEAKNVLKIYIEKGYGSVIAKTFFR